MSISWLASRQISPLLLLPHFAVDELQEDFHLDPGSRTSLVRGQKGLAQSSNPHHLRSCTLKTDSSRLYGLGYPLMQDQGRGQFHLIQCCSHFHTDSEIRYATIELELLAVVRAMSKCKLVTDHRPLVSTSMPTHWTLLTTPVYNASGSPLLPYPTMAIWHLRNFIIAALEDPA